MSIECVLCFICSEQCIKIILSQKGVACIVLYSRYIVLIKLPLLFKKWVGYT